MEDWVAFDRASSSKERESEIEREGRGESNAEDNEHFVTFGGGGGVRDSALQAHFLRLMT